MEILKNFEGLTELDNAHALRINGGDGDEMTPTVDDDGVCDADSVGNIKVTSNNEGTQGTISTCTAKTKKNNETKYAWKVTDTFGY